MKTIKTLFAAVLLSGVSALGQLSFSFSDVAFVGQGQGQVGPSAPSPAASTVLLSENFEGTGAPSGWWANNADFVDFDYTSEVLEGTQSLKVLDGGLTVPAFVGTGDGESNIWVTFQMKTPATVTGTNTFIGSVSTTDGNNIYFILNTEGKLEFGGLVQTAMSPSTAYYVWIHRFNTGTNVVEECAFSTTPDLPAVGSNQRAYTQHNYYGWNFLSGNISFRADGAMQSPIILDNLKVYRNALP